MSDEQRSAKHEEARDSLPPELQSMHDEFVEDYKFATIKRFGRGYVAYLVLADLIRVGCQHSADPIEEEDQSAS